MTGKGPHAGAREAHGKEPAPWSEWVGRRRTAEDVIAPGPVARLAATLDRNEPVPRTGEPLPPGWHWLYFLSAAPQSRLGPDGHEARGDFLPPVPLPSRMWAGGRMTFHQPLRIGETALRQSEVASITPKTGRSGRLVFVTTRHVVSGSEGPAVADEQHIVYREAPAAGTGPPAPEAPPAVPAWQRTVHPDPVLLFRFSALTFNAHRIHYDRPYATTVEGYPGLVVHGPLLAILLLDLLQHAHPEAPPTQFVYRAVAPLFDTAPFTVAGAPAEQGDDVALWAAGRDGAVAMTATAGFVPRG